MPTENRLLGDVCRCTGDQDLDRLRALTARGVDQLTASRIMWAAPAMWAGYLEALATTAAAWADVADLVLEPADEALRAS